MLAPEKLLLEFIARLVYNIDGFPGRLKLYFSQYLAFHFERRLSLSQIQDIENKIASTPFYSSNEIVEAASGLSLDAKIWVIASIQILQSKAEQIDDRVVSRKIHRLLDELIATLNLQAEINKIQEEKRRIETEIHQFQNRPLIKIPTAIWPLSLDYCLRWLLLLSFSYFGYDKDYLTVINTFAIPSLIMTLVYFVGLIDRKSNQKLFELYGGKQKFKFVYLVKTNQYTWLALYLGTSVFISYLLPDQLHILTFFALLFYYLSTYDISESVT